MPRKSGVGVLLVGRSARSSGSAGAEAWWSGASRARMTASSRPAAASAAMAAVTPGFGRTGVTTIISSRTLSKTTIAVGRISMASGTPIGSGLAGARRSMWRTMS